MHKERLAFLFRRYAAKECSNEEKAELFERIREMNTSDLLKELSESHPYPTELKQLDDEAGREILAAIYTALPGSNAAEAPVVKMSGKNAKTWKYVAAGILLVGLATSYFLFRSSQSGLAGNPPIRDVAPGKQGAELILGDGRTVVLDSLGNGLVAVQGHAEVVLQNGELTYSSSLETPGSSSEGSVYYNTMRTPRGRQFQMQLSDGTRVWLNAASSIRFPAYFTHNSREVQVTGEIYLEVKPDQNKPFIVHYSAGPEGRKGKVEVLGTSFNINAYEDEPEITTTLTEGSVRVSSGQLAMVLSPGSQAVIPLTRNDSALFIRTVNVDQVVAWKNGVFNFHQTSLPSAMRQIARWYDVDVVYEKGLPDIQFAGKIQRNLSLMQIIKGLEDEEVHFRIEGKKLIVMP